MADQARLMGALAEHLTEFRQRRWYVNERYWERANMAFVHAKKRFRRDITHEAMVVSRISRGPVRIRRYVLLAGMDEWLSCDKDAFAGFLEEGPRGLGRGVTKVKQTFCSCGHKIHRSDLRASEFAHELARHYGAHGVQRPYRCNENPRAFHLTAQQKGSRALIPGAYNKTEPRGRGDW